MSIPLAKASHAAGSRVQAGTGLGRPKGTDLGHYCNQCVSLSLNLLFSQKNVRIKLNFKVKNHLDKSAQDCTNYMLWELGKKGTKPGPTCTNGLLMKGKQQRSSVSIGNETENSELGQGGPHSGGKVAISGVGIVQAWCPSNNVSTKVPLERAHAKSTQLATS